MCYKLIPGFYACRPHVLHRASTGLDQAGSKVSLPAVGGYSTSRTPAAANSRAQTSSADGRKKRCGSRVRAWVLDAITLGKGHHAVMQRVLLRQSATAFRQGVNDSLQAVEEGWRVPRAYACAWCCEHPRSTSDLEVTWLPCCRCCCRQDGRGGRLGGRGGGRK